MKHSIMNRDLSSYFYSPEHYGVREYYDSILERVADPKSHLHGAVLVQMKQVKTGFSLIVDYRRRWRWVPSIERQWSRRFEWLCVCVQITSTYHDVPDCIKKDHCAEMRTAELQ